MTQVLVPPPPPLASRQAPSFFPHPRRRRCPTSRTTTTCDWTWRSAGRVSSHVQQFPDNRRQPQMSGMPSCGIVRPGKNTTRPRGVAVKCGGWSNRQNSSTQRSSATRLKLTTNQQWFTG